MATNTYKIKKGDTLGGIAKQYNTDVKTIASANKIKDPNKIYAGTTLNIPGIDVPTPVVKVQPTTPKTRNPFLPGGVATNNINPSPINRGSTQTSQAAQVNVAPVVTQTPEEVKKEQANAYAQEVNTISQEVANTTNDIPKSKSSQIIDQLYNSIANGEEDGDVPQAPSFIELYNQTREQLGIDQDEQDLADLDAELDRIQVGELVAIDEAGDRPVSMQQIERRRGTISKEAQRQMAFLNVERSAVARTVQGKTDALKMIMDFTQQDYANASTAYQNKFNRNMQLVQLMQTQEDRETNAVTRLQDTAKANITTVVSMMNEAGKTFDELPANQQAQIQQWELQAGLPAGLIESLPPEESGELMTIGGSLVRVYPDDTIKVLYSKPTSSKSGSSSSSSIKLTPTKKTELLGVGFNAEEITGIEKLVSEYGIDAIENLTDISDEQKQAIYDIYGQGEEDDDISGTPNYKIKGLKNLDNNPLFGSSRRSKLNEAGITDDQLSQAEDYFSQGYDTKQVANYLGLTTEQKNLLDKYTESNE